MEDKELNKYSFFFLLINLSCSWSDSKKSKIMGYYNMIAYDGLMDSKTGES